MRSLIVFVYLSCCICTAFGADQTLQPKQKTDAFFSLIKSGKIEQAYSDLVEDSELMKQQVSALQVLQTQTETALKIYGSVISYELVYEEQLSLSVTRLVYFLNHEKQPTNWEFYFYNPKGKWFLSQITFGDQYQYLGRK